MVLRCRRQGSYARAMLIRLGIAALCLSAIAACSDSGEGERARETNTVIAPSEQAPSTTAVPTTTARSTTGSALDSMLLACNATDLQFAFDFTSAGTGGQRLDFFTILNRSATACIVELPEVVFVTINGEEIAPVVDLRSRARRCASDTEWPCISTLPLVMPPVSATGVRQAQLTLSRNVHDGAGFPCDPPAPQFVAVRVKLAHGAGQLEAPYEHAPCFWGVASFNRR